MINNLMKSTLRLQIFEIEQFQKFLEFYNLEN